MPSQRDKWIRVNRKRLCPICGRKDWCLLSADGEAVICARVESNKKCGEAGWLHKLTGDVKPLPPVRQRKPQAGPGAVEQYARLPIGNRHPVEALAANLGVSLASLDRLGCRWSTIHNAAAFPMQDDQGEIIGVRLRANNGRKWAIIGSHAGLFISDGEVGDQVTELWICEGPTDCAALLDLDVYAVGRPSCTGGVKYLTPLSVGRNVLIMADADETKTRPDGTTWKPGKSGAESLAKELAGIARTVRIIYPLTGKDVRAWLHAGLTAEVLRVLAKNTANYKKGRV